MKRRTQETDNISQKSGKSSRKSFKIDVSSKEIKMNFLGDKYEENSELMMPKTLSLDAPPSTLKRKSTAINRKLSQRDKVSSKKRKKMKTKSIEEASSFATEHSGQEKPDIMVGDLFENLGAQSERDEASKSSVFQLAFQRQPTGGR